VTSFLYVRVCIPDIVIHIVRFVFRRENGSRSPDGRKPVSRSIISESCCETSVPAKHIEQKYKRVSIVYTVAFRSGNGTIKNYLCTPRKTVQSIRTRTLSRIQYDIVNRVRPIELAPCERPVVFVRSFPTQILFLENKTKIPRRTSNVERIRTYYTFVALSIVCTRV